MNNFSECKEIVPGLILGSVSDVEQMVEMGADVLVPLAYLDSDVWNTDFRGEILYCPIKDRGVLPLDVLDTMVLKILIRLDKKRKVALFCAGGHGRTGYLAACVLAALGIKDPIGHLRKEYSPHAVETDAQAEGILTYMEKLKAEMDEIYVPWIDNVSKETNERVRKLFAKFYQTGAKKEIEAQRGDTIPLPFEVVKLSPKESKAALMEDVQRLGFLLDIGFNREASYSLAGIIGCIASGEYDVEEGTIKQLIEAIDAREGSNE